MDAAVEAAVQRVARDAYGRLVAFVAARSHDVAAAQDALSDAFLAALEAWSKTGVPDKPEAWLLVAARRRLIDEARHRQVHVGAAPLLLAAFDEAEECVDEIFPDERLKLMFICAHPAIDAPMRTPLMLQTVLGLDASRIASAFLVRPATMGQRLSRVKSKIQVARIPFEVPQRDDLPERLDGVLDAIYAAYGRGWDDVHGADPRDPNLANEAIGLGSLLVRLMPAEPEALGLLALMLHTDARRNARRDAAGRYVPLSDQDPRHWSREQADMADDCLARAAELHRPGRYQLEAAIQSVHAERARSGKTNWDTILLLYDALARISPRVGPLLGQAAASAQVNGPSYALALLDRLPADSIFAYQPYWALKADLLARMGHRAAARAAFERAIALCEDAAMRAYLAERAEVSRG